MRIEHFSVFLYGCQTQPKGGKGRDGRLNLTEQLTPGVLEMLMDLKILMNIESVIIAEVYHNSGSLKRKSQKVEKDHKFLPPPPSP